MSVYTLQTTRLKEATEMGILEIVLALLLIVFSMVVFYIQFLQWRRKGLPPGPFPVPLIGALYAIGTEPQISLTSLARKYGSIMTLRIGSVDTVIVSSTEAVKLFLRTHDTQFASRPPLTVSEHLFYQGQDVGFTAYGEPWRRMRLVIVNNLLNPKSVESFRQVREKHVSRMMRKLWTDSEQGTVQVDLSEAIFNTIYDIIWATIARNTASMMSKELHHLPRELTQNIARGLLYDFFPWMKTLEPFIGVKSRMNKAYTFFDNFAETVLQEHAATQIAQGQNKSFVDLLLELSEEDSFFTRDKIKSLMLSAFFAAIDTSTMTTDWTVSRLLKERECFLKAQKEVDDIVGSGETKSLNESHLAKMSYLRWVVKETMRVHLTLFLPPRQATEDVIIDNYKIPKGMWVIVNGWAIARDEKVWKDPEEFNPERYAGEKDVDMTGLSDLKSLPFGGGRRGCPGYNMAFQIIFLIVGSLLHNFELQVEGDLDMTADKVLHTRLNHLYVIPKLRNKDAFLSCN